MSTETAKITVGEVAESPGSHIKTTFVPTLKTPDFTPVQIASAIVAGIPHLLILCGVDLTAVQDDALAELVKLALGAMGFDAAIRVGRSIGSARRA